MCSAEGCAGLQGQCFACALPWSRLGLHCSAWVCALLVKLDSASTCAPARFRPFPVLRTAWRFSLTSCQKATAIYIPPPLQVVRCDGRPQD